MHQLLPLAFEHAREHARAHATLIAVLAIAAVLLAISLPGAPITWDEHYQRTYGDLVLRWYASGFQDRGAFEYRNLFLYGGLLEAPMQFVANRLPFDAYVTRHALTGIVALLGAWGVYELARRLAGPWTGVLAAVFLLLTPLYWGHALVNSKDVPFAAAYVWACVALVHFLPRLHALDWRAGAVIGLAFGSVLGLRVGGAVPLAGLLALVWLAAVKRRGLSLFTAARASLPGLGALALSTYAIMVFLWPWALEDPLRRPFLALLVSGRFPAPGDVLFAGQTYPRDALPASYAPTMLGIQLPEFVLAGLLIGVVALARICEARDWPAYVVPVAAAALPLLIVVVARPAMYNGVRHIIFVLPPFAVLAALGWAAALRRSRRVALAALALLLTLTAVEMVRLHPYQYAYSNAISGGLPATHGRYDTVYWGFEDREAAEWVQRNYDRGRVANCSHPITTEPFIASPLRFVGSVHFDLHEQPDILIARLRCPTDLAGRVVHEVQRRGVPLVSVIDLR